MTQIIADSTCDINKELLKGHKLITLPLVISAEGRDYLDGIDIGIDQVYALMRKDVLPKTAQIPYEVMKEEFEKCCQNGENFIYISFSGEMSGCFSLAHVVADELKEKYPERQMEIVDSRGGSCATGLIVLQALLMSEKGMDIEVIVKEINFMIDHVEHLFTVADLKWMVKGGRISKPLGWAGSVLNIRPWLDVKDGKMTVEGMVRGEKKAVQTVIKEVCRRTEDFQRQMIAIAHTGNKPLADNVSRQIIETLPECTTTITEIGGVLGAHLGMGGLGVFFFREPSEHYMLLGAI